VLVQAGNSPRGIAASARFADVVFGFGGKVSGQLRHRTMLDAALQDQGRDPAVVGILWATQVIVGRTNAEAAARRAEVLSFWSEEAVGAFLSHNAGIDFSRLPASFPLGELAEQAAQAQASPSGLIGTLLAEHGRDYPMSRTEFFEHGWTSATGMDHTLCGDAVSVADALEENFAAVGGRGGYMLSSPVAMPSGYDDVAELLVPELRHRGALAPRYPGRTLRENLAVG
jgi:alkanesulfonate monooxygenase SsuD/methylene tetrahydromethanopterin reductase-like flavin-dependent oxidoreductase (luciferase family)